MKSLKFLSLAIITMSTMLMTSTVQASPPTEIEMAVAEKRILSMPVNVSSTVANATRYAIASPINGYLTGLFYVYEGPNAISSGSSLISLRVANVTVPNLNLTVPSGTTALGTVSKTQAISTTARVRAGQAIEVSATGAPVMSGTGSGRLVIEITPNYTPPRFQQ